MTISLDQKPQLNSLANLLTKNMIDQSTAATKSTSDILEKILTNQQTVSGNQTSGEQPLDLSLHSGRKNLDLNDLNLLTSLYANDDSLAGKMKK